MLSLSNLMGDIIFSRPKALASVMTLVLLHHCTHCPYQQTLQSHLYLFFILQS